MTTRMETLVRSRTRPLVMGGVVAGDPYLEATTEHLSALVAGGADIVEVILPFSDPSYHGAVIQRASQRALHEGVALEALAEVLSAWRCEHTDTPLVVSSYFNRMLAVGIEEAALKLQRAGVDGISFSDLPWREARRTITKIGGTGVAYIPSIAPTTPDGRLEEIVEACEGGLAIWTGHVGGEIEDRAGNLARLAEQTTLIDGRLAMVASMSVSTPAEARVVGLSCDGVLVGSALVWLVEGRGADLHERLETFVRDLREGLDAQSSSEAPSSDASESPDPE